MGTRRYEKSLGDEPIYMIPKIQSIKDCIGFCEYLKTMVKSVHPSSPLGIVLKDVIDHLELPFGKNVKN
jgi:hypothetical protein